MKNLYSVLLFNNQGSIFDSKCFNNLKKAKAWAQGRNGIYHARIYRNAEAEPLIYIPRK